MNGYQQFEKIKQCYNSMTDDLSKEIFMARLQYDMEPSLQNIHYFFNVADSYYSERMNIKEDIITSNKTIYFYGAGIYGYASMQSFNLLFPDIKIKGFFDRNYQNIKYVHNIPVYAPPTKQWVQDNKENDYCIYITSKDYISEIKDYLLDIGVKNSSIKQFCSDENIKYLNSQYFEFKEYYKPNGVFIDAGCFDGQTSIMFANWCDNQYSKIYAFEPDSKNIKLCENNKQFMSLKNLNLINAGVGNKECTVRFCDENNQGSHISETGNSYINIKTIDNIVKNEYVSFIKMDIEGAELDALQGAAETIKRDKPFCAICVYHRAGDIIAIAEYLKELVPEYKFKIRHYAINMTETILYAYIE